MNLTIVCTVCVLALSSGVYAKLMNSDTRVDVTVFAPSHFFTNTSRVLFHADKDVEVLQPDTASVLVYGVGTGGGGGGPETETSAFGWDPCSLLFCEHGCDENTGRCICFKGFKLNDLGRCVDVNECMEGRAKCDAAAGCYNRKGSYDCICGEDFYGDGKTCRDCSQPCPARHYEVQPCTVDKKKICEPCTPKCPKGFYQATPCSGHENAFCRVCQPPCDPGQFEKRQCSHHHNRECQDLNDLRPPTSSENMLVEEKKHVQEDKVWLEKRPAHYVGLVGDTLRRGAGITVKVTTRFIDAFQRYVPVNVSQPFNIAQAAPSVLTSYAVQRYCPSPMPDYYILRYKKHEDLTYRPKADGSIEACETHTQFGDFLPPDTGSPQSFLCSQPGSLTSAFNVDDNFFHARTKWVDKNKRCQRNSQLCMQCISDCGEDVINKCSISGDDSDNGGSPRLMMCYNCCAQKNCSALCEDYHKRRCQPEQCSKGNLLEFFLEPSWDSSQDGRFYCHIKPLQTQHLLDLEYTVESEVSSTPLHKGSLNLYGNDQWEKEGVMEYSDGIISVVINSSLGRLPNFLEGDTAADAKVFKVGTYKWSGAEFGSSSIQLDNVFLRPPAPTGAPSMSPPHQDCTNLDLAGMLLASTMDNPYLRNHRLEGHANLSLPFTVEDKDRQPVVTVTLPKTTPILKILYAPAKLVVKKLSGNILRNGSDWLIVVSGQVVKCPGYLHFRVLDPNYVSRVLFDCDAVVFCPKNFTLTFAQPTLDLDGMHKDVVVEVEDGQKIHHVRLHRRSSLEVEERVEAREDKDLPSYVQEPGRPRALRHQTDTTSSATPEEAATPDLPVPLPYLLAIGGVIMLLLVLAVIGLCFQPGPPETPFAQVHHVVLAVMYMVFQAAYSLIVTGTVFFLILSVITGPHVNFVLQHGQHGAVSIASSHIELLQLRRHLEAEVSRQDRQVDSTEEQCMVDVRSLLEDMKKLHRALLDKTEDVFERHRLDLLLEQQKLHVRQRLTQDLKAFRNNYLKMARLALKRVNQDTLAAFHNVQNNNTWLNAARFLHKIINAYRQNQPQPMEVKNFMEWSGIKADINKLEIDLSFSLPPLPRLDDLLAPPPDQPPIKRDMKENEPRQEKIRSIQVHNNWFFPLDESTINGAGGFQPVSRDNLEAERKTTPVVFFVFLGLFVFCDLILLAHRMFKAWTVAKLILYGFPEYFREKKEMVGDDEVFQENPDSRNQLAPVQSCKDSPMIQSVKAFFIQTISTTFFPKVVGAIAACVLLSCLLRLSNKYLTVAELGRMGLYHSADEYLDLQASITNARLEAHAQYINSVDFPAFQATMSGYLSRHRSVLGIYRKHLTGLQTLSAEMYCEHLKAIELTGNCTDFISDGMDERWDAIAGVSHACQFTPVAAHLFNRKSQSKSPLYERQVEALLHSLRYVVYHCSQLAIIFLSVIVIKELASAVLWILISRSGMIRIRIIVEHDQDETTQ